MKNLLYLFSLPFLTCHAFAQQINYEVSFPNLVHHEANISVTVSNAPQKELTFRMSRSSPGRYATHEYGKNIYDVKAFDKSGQEIALQRIDGDVYKVSGLNGFANVQYTLYANHADGTYAGLDQSSIHLNAPATFMWIKELQKAPIEIKFDLPKDGKWTIATQLKPGAQPNTFSATDLQYFMDSPIKIGKLTIKEWTLNNPDKRPAKFRLALEVSGSDSLADGFAAKVKRITQESQAIFGELPAFDFGQYTFLASINPYVQGDGMEHRNSTMISIPVTFGGSNNLLGVFSHEFFHAWNVERIRPKTLEPFNFEKSNMSFELWFAEGFTQYYGDLILARAGFSSPEEYCQELSFLVNTKENTAGAKRISPAQASNNAVFVDAGVSIDKTNYPNIYTSYYPYGASIALALDLQLRTRGLTLDGYMQAVWQKHGKPEIAYQISDLQDVLAAYSKDKTFAEGFFAKYINGHESFDYAPLFQMAGLALKREFSGKAWIGNVRYKEGADLTIQSNTIVDSPLYIAGLDIADQIVKLDGKTVTTQAELAAILVAHKPGEEIGVEYRHRGETKMSMITLKENPQWIVQLNETANLPVTEEMKKFRKDWLGSKIQ